MTADPPGPYASTTVSFEVAIVGLVVSETVTAKDFVAEVLLASVALQ